MFAINHAATALLVKKQFPEKPIIPLLLSVQLMELLWVGLNLSGIERTTTEPTVRSVSDLHLAFMPYSHSVVMSLAYAVVAWVLLSVVFHRIARSSACYSVRNVRLRDEASSFQRWCGGRHGEKQSVRGSLAIDVDDKLFAHLFDLRDPIGRTPANESNTNFPEFRQ